MKAKKGSLEMMLKTEMSVMWQISAGREFQMDRPATENARSLNLVKVGETVHENVS